MIQTKEIKKWCIDAEVTGASIARQVGVSGPMVYMIISGKRKSKAVVDAFINRGCPANYFGREEEHGQA